MEAFLLSFGKEIIALVSIALGMSASFYGQSIVKKEIEIKKNQIQEAE